MSPGFTPASRRHQRAAASGSSHVENGTGVLPCLRREKRSSSAAATISPSTTIAAAGSWKTALTPSTTAMAPPALGPSNPYPASNAQTSVDGAAPSTSAPESPQLIGLAVPDPHRHLRVEHGDRQPVAP